jgi:hypothetical protein
MDFTAFLEWLGALPISMHIAETWWFPLLESIHVLASTFLVGSVLMVDLRLLGVASRSQAVTRLTREVLPWTRVAGLVAVVTGFGLFVANTVRYMENPAFQVKLTLLAFAGINMAFFHVRTMRSVIEWDRGDAIPFAARFAGGFSVVLWIGILLSGRWVGHLI